jgi:hypothetical protein
LTSTSTPSVADVADVADAGAAAAAAFFLAMRDLYTGQLVQKKQQRTMPTTMRTIGTTMAAIRPAAIPTRTASS